MSGYCPDCGNTLCVCSEIRAWSDSNLKLFELEAKLAIAEGEWKTYFKSCESLAEKLAESERKNKKLREALKWYADLGLCDGYAKNVLKEVGG